MKWEKGSSLVLSKLHSVGGDYEGRAYPSSIRKRKNGTT